MSTITALFALAVAGAAAGVYLPEPRIFGACGVGLALCGIWLWRGTWPMLVLRTHFTGEAIGRPLLRRGFLYAIGFLAPAAAAASQTAEYASVRALLPYGQAVVLEGTVQEIVPTRQGGMRWRMLVTGWLPTEPAAASTPHAAFVVELSVYGEALALPAKSNDRVRVRTRLHPMPPQDTPGSFDAFHFGLARTLHARASLRRSADLVWVERGTQHLSFAEVRSELRKRLLALGTPKEAAILLALLVGETVLFEPDELEMYRRIGAGHLLAVSGLQVSALAWLIYRVSWLLLWCLPGFTRRGGARVAASLTTLIAIWAFVALCGAPPSVCRAAGMATLVLIFPLVGHRVRGTETIAWTGWCSILWHPVLVLDPSFLLSYGAILGLLAAFCTPKPGSFGRWRQFFLAGLAPGICTAPISIELFGSWAPGGLVANLVLVPAAAILQVPAIAMGLVGAGLQESHWVHWGAAAGGVLEALCMGMDAWLGHLWPMSAPGALETAGWFVVTLLLVRALAGAPMRGRDLVLVACLACLCASPAIRRPKGIEVTALPVGQGDSVVLRFPSGEVILVDGGGTFDGADDTGARVLLPFFQRRDIKKIDLIVISHPHPDHVLGLHTVLEKMPVGALLHPGYGAEQTWMRQILRMCQERNVPVHVARDQVGRHFIGQAEFEILAPFPEDGAALYPELGANDNSLVLRVGLGDDRLLLTGDIEAYGEMYLLESGVSLEAAIVKAPHHGSRTSSSAAFVAATRAQHVLFNTGWRNHFGFPHIEVERRWADAGAQLWDTARHGEITFWLTGQGVKAHPHRTAEDPLRRRAE